MVSKIPFLSLSFNEVGAGMQDDNLRSDVDDIDYQNSRLQQFKEESISSGQLSYAQLHEVMRNIFSFTSAIEKSLNYVYRKWILFSAT